MRLIDTRTLELREFFGDAIPEYAILSHTWGDEEVTFQDWTDREWASTKEGYDKIQGACKKARSEQIKWLWVDTNCIDKSSSAELTEAINSMFDWYKRAEVCYAHLSDVPNKNTVDSDTLDARIHQSRWFKRGWTLQELLAPQRLVFYASDWSRIGTRNTSMAGQVRRITGIASKYLQGNPDEVQRALISRKMSWLASRTTTRVEDMAYCMMGLFDINMPLLYGEGEKAFTRLQQEIIKASNDHTIFCWTWTPDVPDDWTSLLAPSASQFRQTETRSVPDEDPDHEISVYSMTNAGLSIQLPIVHLANSSYVLILQARPFGVSSRFRVKCGIPGCGTRRRNGTLHVFRQRYPPTPVILNTYSASHLQIGSILVTNRRRDDEGKVLTMFEKAMSKLTSTTTTSAHRAAIIAFDSSDLQREWEIGGITLNDGHDKVTDYIVFDSPAASDKYRVDATLLALTLPMSGSTVIPEGSPLGNLPGGHSVTIFIYAAVRESIDSGHIYGYCQIFINLISTSSVAGSRDHIPTESILEQLKQKTLDISWRQPVSYLPDLDMSVMLDVSNTDHSNGKGLSFLRFSRGLRRVLLRKVPRVPEPDAAGSDHDLDDDSGDSAAAIVHRTHALRSGKAHLPVKGGFAASTLEDGYMRWREEFIRDREGDGWSEGQSMSSARQDSAVPRIDGLSISD